MTAETKQADDQYGIGAVARLTGLTDHTIRVWERRYKAVVAKRAPNGRRIYSSADVDKLGLLKRLTDEGLSIGQIAACTTAELRERARGIDEIGTTAVPERIRVAVLGDFVPCQLEHHDRSLAPVEVVVADNSQDRILADVSGQNIDVLVMECPVLDPESKARLEDLMDKAGAARGVIVYTFSRDRDIQVTEDSRITVLRAPARIDEVRMAIMRAYSPPQPVAANTPIAKSGDADWDVAGSIAPRRFNQQQLATLAQASTAVDCECPHHLAQLVNDLSAFEIYSANCASRDADDAALHAYLHHTTAEARALIEAALEKVAIAEGIAY